MAVNRDFRDLFSSFVDADVRFLVVGAHAVIHYSVPRYTKDLDFGIDPTPENALRPRPPASPRPTSPCVRRSSVPLGAIRALLARR
jgi:hypothetical protein